MRTASRRGVCASNEIVCAAHVTNNTAWNYLRVKETRFDMISTCNSRASLNVSRRAGRTYLW